MGESHPSFTFKQPIQFLVQVIIDYKIIHKGKKSYIPFTTIPFQHPFLSMIMKENKVDPFGIQNGKTANQVKKLTQRIKITWSTVPTPHMTTEENHQDTNMEELAQD